MKKGWNLTSVVFRVGEIEGEGHFSSVKNRQGCKDAFGAVSPGCWSSADLRAGAKEMQ